MNSVNMQCRMVNNGSYAVPKLRMYRLIKEIVQQNNAELRMQSAAVAALHTAAEAHIISYMEDLSILASHGGRITIKLKDSVTLKLLKGENLNK
uniref:Histone H2A/H2B/H3 domain-containing protein n=1 Tax=Panagrolaimus superbus TaxID=310955 RepID=A0A914Z7T8_9BILA